MGSGTGAMEHDHLPTPHAPAPDPVEPREDDQMAEEELTEQQRRETLTEVFASFALDGMLPTDADLALARAYVAGEVTLEAIIEDALNEFRRS